MRSEEEIRKKILELEESFDYRAFHEDWSACAKIKGKIEALEWVLGEREEI